MLALLALALFPVLAHAESAEKVYETAIPSVESTPQTTAHHSTPKSSTNEHKSSNPKKAEGSAASGTNAENSAEPEGEAEKEGQKKSGGATSGGGNNNPPSSGGAEGGGKSSQSGIGPGKKAGGNVSKTEGKPTPTASEGPVTESSSGGGSSPVVPILIVVVILAAISIGVVLYRQRKSGQGPDRRVSSPNAS
jgi:cobalamin biosynthesis Mg chelatase CobN